MINSLLKDSHIAQPYCRSNFEDSTQNRKRSRGQSATVNTSISTSANNCKPANVSFGGFFSPIKEFNFHKSTKVKAVLEKLDANPLLYESIFALGLTCFLRPASIMALPSEKKNKGDKVYAAAHSIASGIISFVITLAIVTPITTGLKKVLAQIDAPGKEKKMEKDVAEGLCKPEDLEKLRAENKARKTFIKDSKSYLFDSNYSKTAGTYIKKVPEMFIAMPRATITIALIPLILKYVFGMEKTKKPKGDKTLNPILDNPAAINHNNMSQKMNNVNKVSGGVK